MELNDEKLKRIRNKNINSQITEIVENYEDIIVPYIKDITGKSEEEISEEQINKQIVNMLYIATNSKDYHILEGFSRLSREEIKEKLVQNAYIREVLNKKLGIKKDYEFDGKIGDHGLCDSNDFTISDIENIADSNISPDQFNDILFNYLSEMIEVVKRNPNLNLYLIFDKKFDNDEDLKNNFNEFINGKENLNMENKIIVKEFINLISTYPLNELLNNSESVKKEIKSGLYDFIRTPNKKICNEDRQKINDISNIWDRQDVANYANLPLLLKRYNDIIENNKINEIPEIVTMVNDIQNAIYSGVPNLESANEFKENMNNWYGVFEKANKEDIINSIYTPNSDSNIDEKDKVPESLLVHFYNPNRSLIDIFRLAAINRCRIKNGEEAIIIKNPLDIFRNEDVRNKIAEDLKRFEGDIDTNEIRDAAEELKPGKTFKFNESDTKVPRQNVLEAASNQMACYLINNESLLDLLDYDKMMTSGSQNVAFAVGLSSNGVNPDNIILSCDENANSNLGIDNVPCEDRFVNLSKTYLEISGVKNKRTEILLNRNGLNADYLLVLKGMDITENDEKLIESEVTKAKNLGLKVVDLDIGEINLNEKKKYEEDIII